MIFIDRWLLNRDTVSNDLLIKWSLCTGFLKKSACQIWHENYLTQNQPFTKFVEAASNFTMLVKLQEVCKICKQLFEVCRICQQLYKVHRIRQQLYKVPWTYKQVLWSL